MYIMAESIGTLHTHKHTYITIYYDITGCSSNVSIYNLYAQRIDIIIIIHILYLGHARFDKSRTFIRFFQIPNQ